MIQQNHNLPDPLPKRSVSRSSRGNALMEYGMIGGTITIMAIVGMTISGMDLLSEFKGLKTDMRHTIASSSITRYKPQAVEETTESSSSAVAEPPAPPPPDGNPYLWQDIMPTYRQYQATGDMKDMVATAGANGMTDILAGNMTVYANQLLADGAITEDEAGSLQRLSNLGHSIAYIEWMAENAYRNCSGETTCFNSAKGVYDGGEQYVKYLVDDISNPHDYSNSAEALMATIPNSTITGRDLLLSDPTTHGYGVLNDFLVQFKAIKDSGILKDPVMAQQFDNMAVEITLLASQTSGTAAQLSSGAIQPTDGGNTLCNHIASDVTHYDAKQFCTAGSGSDSGHQCF